MGTGRNRAKAGEPGGVNAVDMDQEWARVQQNMQALGNTSLSNAVAPTGVVGTPSTEQVGGANEPTPATTTVSAPQELVDAGHK
jgi:hypothetical protein